MEKGTKLGRYEIREKIGAGGMGEVYLAHDEQLDRSVALKVLLPEFSANADRVQRFKLEARAASTLNHPSIITIHEVGESGNRIFIATELVSGVTLRQKIEEGNLTVSEAVEIARQIAGALVVAHEARIVHRDIKPENVMIRLDGYAKILDFGLAKSILYQAGGEDRTLQMVHTQPGLVMGSVRYMSPEQARGKDVDERTDVWSLGVVLYEMLTGANPFDGETSSDSLAAVLHVQPAPLPPKIPAELQLITTKALQKKADDRYQTIGEMAADLRAAENRLKYDSNEVGKLSLAAENNKTAHFVPTDTSENKTLIHETASLQMAEKTDRQDKKGRLRFLPLGILLVAVLLAVGAWFGISRTTKPAARFETFTFSRLTENGKSSQPAFSPDGKYVAYTNIDNNLRSLVVRQTATGSTVQIAPPTNLGYTPPVFSPDGNYVYFVTAANGIGTLYQTPALGGAAKKILVDIDSKVTISPDGKRLAFIRDDVATGISRLIVADIEGKNEEPLLDSQSVGEKRFLEAAWSPRGDEILVAAAERMFANNSNQGKFLIVGLADKKARPIGDQLWQNINSLSWLLDNSGFYFLAKAQSEEPTQIRFIDYASGEARQITSDSSGYSGMSLAATGKTIVASKFEMTAGLWSYTAPNRESVQLSSDSRSLQGARGLLPLPDGRLLISRDEDYKPRLWTIDADGRQEKRWTTNNAPSAVPSLSPNGKFVVYSAMENDRWRIWKADVSGENAVALTTGETFGDWRPQVAADNRTIIFQRRFDDISKSKIYKVDAETKAEAALMPDSTTNDSNPSVSPDGKLLAFTAQSFDNPALGFRSVIKFVAIDSAAFVAPFRELDGSLSFSYSWAADGKSINYIDNRGAHNIYELKPEGQPKQITNFGAGSILNFAQTADGKRFYVVRGTVNSDLILIKDSEK